MRSASLWVGEHGKITIPEDLCKELGIEVGHELIARIEGDRLVLETREAVLSRLKSRFAHIPPEVSLADELIMERRKESGSE